MSFWPQATNTCKMKMTDWDRTAALGLHSTMESSPAVSRNSQLNIIHWFVQSSKKLATTSSNLQPIWLHHTIINQHSPLSSSSFATLSFFGNQNLSCPIQVQVLRLLMLHHPCSKKSLIYQQQLPSKEIKILYHFWDHQLMDLCQCCDE